MLLIRWQRYPPVCATRHAVTAQRRCSVDQERLASGFVFSIHTGEQCLQTVIEKAGVAGIYHELYFLHATFTVSLDCDITAGGSLT